MVKVILVLVMVMMRKAFNEVVVRVQGAEELLVKAATVESIAEGRWTAIIRLDDFAGWLESLKHHKHAAQLSAHCDEKGLPSPHRAKESESQHCRRALKQPEEYQHGGV